MTDAERYAHLRAAVDEAMSRLMDMRALRTPESCNPGTIAAEAQTIAGDAWRILDAATKETA